MTRDERQQQCIDKWIKNNGVGTIEGCTGFGKTRISLTIMQRAYNKNKNVKIIVIVPTIDLKDQWENQIKELNINAECYVINTAVTKQLSCNLLVLDEIHMFAAPKFKQIFTKCKYKFILGLTATFERNDGEHKYISKFCPIVDTVDVQTALKNNWVSNFTEIDVLLDVPLTQYKNLNKQFMRFFSMFGYDFNAVKKSLTDKGCIEVADENGWTISETKINAVNTMRYMRNRIAWIHKHKKKIEVTKEIIDKRLDKKIVTFSQTKEQAEELASHSGVAYHSGLSKKQLTQIMNDFKNGKINVLHTINKINLGADISHLEVGIIVCGNSARSSDIQRLGKP